MLSKFQLHRPNNVKKLSGSEKTTETTWPKFSPSKVRLKNKIALERWSSSLALRICEVNIESIENLVTARFFFGRVQTIYFVM